jgi:hypothetical protein
MKNCELVIEYAQNEQNQLNFMKYEILYSMATNKTSGKKDLCGSMPSLLQIQSCNKVYLGNVKFIYICIFQNLHDSVLLFK